LPLPCIEDVKRREAAIFDQMPSALPGIDLNVEEQLALLQKFKEYYKQQPFSADKKPGLRYFLDNPWYAWGDGIVLYCMIRALKPKRLIEVGSGYSSCVILDTNELFFDNAISCLFIEPYPDRFFSLISYWDRMRIDTFCTDLQDVDLTLFDGLCANDILLIDSSHVAKTGSDVNQIFSHILPRLRSGVYVHFHDIYYPFEYPKQWVYEGRGMERSVCLAGFLAI
jgi:predicted O-methyltransferase YrrM